MNNNILFKGNVPASDIVIHDHPNRFFDSPLSPKEIDKRWQDYLITAAKEKKKVWDAPIFRLQNFSYQAHKLHLQFGTIMAREIAVLRTCLEEIDVNNTDKLIKNTFVASLIKTTDQKYVFGLKSGISVGNPRIDLIGGVLSRAEISVTNGADLLTALYNEFTEEANIPKQHILASTLRGILLSSNLSIGLIWHSELSLRSWEINAYFKMQNDGELSELCFVPVKELKSFLKLQGSYLPWLTELIDDVGSYDNC